MELSVKLIITELEIFLERCYPEPQIPGRGTRTEPPNVIQILYIQTLHLKIQSAFEGKLFYLNPNLAHNTLIGFLTERGHAPLIE